MCVDVINVREKKKNCTVTSRESWWGDNGRKTAPGHVPRTYEEKLRRREVRVVGLCLSSVYCDTVTVTGISRGRSIKWHAAVYDDENTIARVGRSGRGRPGGWPEDGSSSSPPPPPPPSRCTRTSRLTGWPTACRRQNIGGRPTADGVVVVVVGDGGRRRRDGGSSVRRAHSTVVSLSSR